jgi:hypothetical protein
MSDKRSPLYVVVGGGVSTWWWEGVFLLTQKTEEGVLSTSNKD